jgi:hypothetical protein
MGVNKKIEALIAAYDLFLKQVNQSNWRRPHLWQGPVEIARPVVITISAMFE